RHVGDADPTVRASVAIAFGHWDDPKAGIALGQLAGHAGSNPYSIAPLVSSLNRTNFATFLEQPELNRGGRDAPIQTLRPMLLAIQPAAVVALARLPSERAADALVNNWPGYSPAIRSAVVRALLRRDAWVPKLLAAVDAGTIPVSAVPPGDRQALLTSPNKAL